MTGQLRAVKKKKNNLPLNNLKHLNAFGHKAKDLPGNKMRLKRRV